MMLMIIILQYVIWNSPIVYKLRGRSSRLTVNSVNFKSRDLGTRLGQVNVLCSWARQHSLSASLHPGIKMGTGEFSGKPDEILGGGGPCDGLATHPGGSNTHGCLMLNGDQDKLRTGGSRVQTSPFYSIIWRIQKEFCLLFSLCFSCNATY